MKYLISILFGSLILGCATEKHWVLVEHIDADSLGQKFISSLQQSGVDTIICYEENFGGCMVRNDNPFYLYWEKNGSSYVTKFTNYSRYDTLNHQFNTSIFQSIEDTLKKEKMEEPKGILPGYYYYYHYSDRMTIILGNYHLIYSIGSEKFSNEYTYQVMVIDKFRSFLLDFEPWEWHQYDLKYEKQKFPKKYP